MRGRIGAGGKAAIARAALTRARAHIQQQRNRCVCVCVRAFGCLYVCELIMCGARHLDFFAEIHPLLGVGVEGVGVEEEGLDPPNRLT